MKPPAPQTQGARTPVEFQALYDKIFPKYDDEEKYGRYGQLVYTLEEVFRAAGYDIPGKELASKHHNRIVCAIGLPTLPKIAHLFIGWVTVPTLTKYLHDFPDYSYGGIYRSRQLSLKGTMEPWNNFLKTEKKERRIGNRGAKYNAFIDELAAMPQVWATMTAAAQKVVDSYEQEMSQMKVKADERNQRRLDGIAHLRRTAEIIEAFGVIAGVDDTGKADGLRQLAAAVEEHVSVRWFTYRKLTPEKVLADSVASVGAKKLPQLRNLWQAMYPLKLAEYINSACTGLPYRVQATQSIGDYRMYVLVQNDAAEIPTLETLESLANEQRGQYGGFAAEDGHPIDLVRVYGENFVVVIKGISQSYALFNPNADALVVLDGLNGGNLKN